MVKTTARIIKITPILSRGLKNDKIIRTKVNPAKIPRNNWIYTPIECFSRITKPITNNNQEIMKRIRIITKIVFFPKFFKPEINLIIISRKRV